jgi:hypothetical protein
MFYYYRNKLQWIHAAEMEGYVVVIYDEYLFAHDPLNTKNIRGHFNTNDNYGYVENDYIP